MRVIHEVDYASLNIFFSIGFNLGVVILPIHVQFLQVTCCSLNKCIVVTTSTPNVDKNLKT